ncbi:MAG: hypothetical protein CMJ50_06165, partial [Planctomycetaceae bacterium]|nr:hypothetical protein [Planctomycetaceae bacterium]
VRSFIVVFRSAKARSFRGAKGDYRTVIPRTILRIDAVTGGSVTWRISELHFKHSLLTTLRRKIAPYFGDNNHNGILGHDEFA